MAQDEDQGGEESKKYVAVGLYVCAMLLAVASVVISFFGVSSDPVWVVDRLMVYNVGFQSEEAQTPPTLTTHQCFRFMLACSIILLLAMMVGVVAALFRNKLLKALVVVIALLYCLCAVASVSFILTRYSMVTPTVYREMNFFCNETNYDRLYANMNCTGALTPAPVCSQVCLDRVSALLQVDGCTLLPMLCKQDIDIAAEWWKAALWLSVASIVTSLLLLFVSIASCCHLYSMNVNRRGKPTAENLCCLMLCPCCPGDAGKGHTHLEDDDDYDDGDEALIS